LSIGSALVQHPHVRAVGFTGSFRGGRALMDLAAKRHEPIPVYAEMGSSNPVFILPQALEQRGDQLATGLHGSFTLGGRRFFTKPGLVFLPETAKPFSEKVQSLTQQGPAFSLLTGGIASVYGKQVAERSRLKTAEGAPSTTGFAAQTALLETTFSNFQTDPAL